MEKQSKFNGCAKGINQKEYHPCLYIEKEGRKGEKIITNWYCLEKIQVLSKKKESADIIYNIRVKVNSRTKIQTILNTKDYKEKREWITQ